MSKIFNWFVMIGLSIPVVGIGAILFGYEQEFFDIVPTGSEFAIVVAVYVVVCATFVIADVMHKYGIILGLIFFALMGMFTIALTPLAPIICFIYWLRKLLPQPTTIVT